MSIKHRVKSLAEQLEELDKPSKDFDPEALGDHGGESESESDGEDKATAGRDHYEIVGKSKLRKQDVAPLGPQYKGSRVSRDAALEEDSDDPFSREFEGDESEEESEDGISGYRNGGLNDFEEKEEKEENEENGFEGETMEEKLDDLDEPSDTELGDDKDISDDREEEESGSGADEEQSGPDRAELRKMMAEQQKSVTASLSQAAKSDAEKGAAVKKQRAVFDSLLNTRIRIQKALQSTNSLVVVNSSGEPDGIGADTAIAAAEAAALTLWNSLNSLRDSLQAKREGVKRKHEDLDESASNDMLWLQMGTFERDSIYHRQTVLDKWSRKAKNTVVIPTTRRLNVTAEQSLVTILNNHISDSDRLIKRTRVPRSCAPSQVAQGLTESNDIYDDADFYGPLLKDLLEQRSQDNISGLNGLNFQSVAPWQAAREAKTKKVVDTRASKGRKMRFAVQEKIQNFMAAEDRGTWGDRQREELFAGLFGRRVELEENAEAASEEEDGKAGHDGFVLFGS